MEIMSSVHLDEDELALILKALYEYVSQCRGGAQLSKYKKDIAYYNKEELDALDLHIQISAYKDELDANS